MSESGTFFRAAESRRNVTSNTGGRIFMLTAEQNFRLLQEIESNRAFILQAYQLNPKLLERAEPRIRQLYIDMNACDMPGETALEQGSVAEGAVKNGVSSASTFAVLL